MTSNSGQPQNCMGLKTLLGEQEQTSHKGPGNRWSIIDQGWTVTGMAEFTGQNQSASQKKKRIMKVSVRSGSGESPVGQDVESQQSICWNISKLSLYKETQAGQQQEGFHQVNFKDIIQRRRHRPLEIQILKKK